MLHAAELAHRLGGAQRAAAQDGPGEGRHEDEDQRVEKSPPPDLERRQDSRPSHDHYPICIAITGKQIDSEFAKDSLSLITFSFLGSHDQEVAPHLLGNCAENRTRRSSQT